MMKKLTNGKSSRNSMFLVVIIRNTSPTPGDAKATGLASNGRKHGTAGTTWHASRYKWMLERDLLVCRLLSILSLTTKESKEGRWTLILRKTS